MGYKLTLSLLQVIKFPNPQPRTFRKRYIFLISTAFSPRLIRQYAAVPTIWPWYSTTPTLSEIDDFWNYFQPNKADTKTACINAKNPSPWIHREGFFSWKNRPGIELFSRGATPKLSSPQQRFTSEFGKGSVWFHRAIDTRKAWWFWILDFGF